MRKVIFLSAVLALALWASQPWKAGSAANWTAGDAQRVLNDSPWAQSAAASFGATGEEDEPPPGPSIDVPQAGMAGPHGASDGRWDGGVGRRPRGGPPVFNVVVRWDSSLPVRQALDRTHTPSVYKPEQIPKDYIITVLGLVPASPGSNPSEMLAGVMRYSRIWPKDKPPIGPDDAKLDEATGALHLFFSRKRKIEPNDKEVTFQTRFGSLSIVKRFRLKDMLYNGQLEL
ncbi:MAG: hypothetical protein M3Y24_09665 [Acidobacteriota bacterium]|nr:hypothetical protein [Acidobacteriota bacterium]